MAQRAPGFLGGGHGAEVVVVAVSTFHRITKKLLKINELTIFLSIFAEVETEIELAKNAKEARWACDPFPLEIPGDPRYVDLTEYFGLCRGGENTLISDLDPSTRGRPYFHAVLAGPRGVGKSTLILQNFDEFRCRGLFPVYVDILSTLDPSNISYSDLLLTLVTQIDNALENNGITIDESARKLVIQWFSQ